MSPVIGIGIIGVFLYWIWTYRDIIIATFRKIGVVQLVIIIALIIVSLFLTVFAFVILVRDKGYSFGFADGYHALNLSQLASMIPGGIWGYAGLAGILWSKRISKADSVVIIFFYTLSMLSACAVVGISGLVQILGWGYTIICLLPFLFLLLGRNWLDKVRQQHFPQTSPLPSTKALLEVLALGMAVWIITSFCFAWLVYNSEGLDVTPFWIIVGAYAAGYLGGYIAIFAPSGLGVSEGLVTLILGPYIGTNTILAIAISFRIIQTIVIWLNILYTVIIISRGAQREID